MRTAWDCQELPNSGSVRPASAEARNAAPTGPQVQNANACARPIRGEKSRTSEAVMVTPAPSMNSIRQRTASSPVTESTVASRKLQAAVMVRVGTSRATRPHRSDRMPPNPAEMPPTSTDRAAMSPYCSSDMPRSVMSSGRMVAIVVSKLATRLASTAMASRRTRLAPTG
jgi:hypothetical protein